MGATLSQERATSTGRCASRSATLHYEGMNIALEKAGAIEKRTSRVSHPQNQGVAPEDVTPGTKADTDR